MTSLEEVRLALDASMESVGKMSKYTPYSPEVTSGFLESFQSVIDDLYSTTHAYQQLLAYIISTELGGKFIMSGYEVSTEFNGYNFSVNIIREDDNSLVVETSRELQK